MNKVLFETKGDMQTDWAIKRDNERKRKAEEAAAARRRRRRGRAEGCQGGHPSCMNDFFSICMLSLSVVATRDSSEHRVRAAHE